MEMPEVPNLSTPEKVVCSMSSKRTSPMQAATKRRITRRRFLKLAGALGLAAAAGGADALFVEPKWIQVTRPTIAITDLPPAWDRATIAHLSDIHLGRFIGLDYVRKLVAMTNDLRADIIAITGDFVSRRDAITSSFADSLRSLRANEGVFGVWGNHDYWTDVAALHAMAQSAGIEILTNSHRVLDRKNQKLCIAGVDDLMAGRPSLTSALRHVPENVRRLLLAHNPDFAEQMPNRPHVDVMLCGHTHGGQISLPLLGRPLAPIRHKRYAAGLVDGPCCPVYTSRGLGMIGAPVRFNCRPELAFITLRRA